MEVTRRQLLQGMGAAAVGAALSPLTPAGAQTPTQVHYISCGTTESEHAWNAKWVAEFNKTHAQIQIKMEEVPWPDLLTKVAAYTAAGISPDIAWYNTPQLNEWVRLGILEPLDAWLGPTKKDFLPSILDPKVSDVIFGGKMMGAPFTYQGYNLIVRADNMRAAGVDPLACRTWDGFAKAAHAVTHAPTRYAASFPMEDTLRTAIAATMYFRGFGLDGIHDIRPSKQAAYIQTLTYIKNLFPTMPPSMVSWKYVDVLQAYSAGLVSLKNAGSWAFGELEPTSPQVMTPQATKNLPWPSVQHPNGILPMSTVGYVMFKASMKKPAAAEVLKYFTNTKPLLEWPMNMVPKRGTTVADRVAVNMFGEKMRWYLQDWNDMMRTSTLSQWIAYSPTDEINAMFRDELLKMYQGKVTPAQAYADLVGGIKPILKTPLA